VTGVTETAQQDWYKKSKLRDKKKERVMSREATRLSSVTITDYLTIEHRVFLEQFAYLEELKAAQEDENSAGLKEAAFAIVRAVEKHAELEEKFLFPALEPFLGAQQMGPIAIMEFEHKEIRAILDALREAKEAHSIRVETSKLIVFLRDHIAKEEKVLFPIAEERIGSDRLRAMVQESGLADKIDELRL
jgi:hemerythrin-like domain-containing protein